MSLGATDTFLGSESNRRPGDRDDPPWILIATLVYLPLALAGAGWILWRGGDSALFDRLIGGTPWRNITIGICVGFGVVVLGRLASAYLAPARRLEVALARLIGPLRPRTCLYLALLSGFGEEIFFRGAIQPELGLVWTSIIFGLLHWPLSRDLLWWTPFAIVAGFLFGWLYRATGDCVLAPALAHLVVNALNMSHLRTHWLNGGVLEETPETEIGPEPQQGPKEMQ